MQCPRHTPVPELKQYIVWNTRLFSCSWKPPRYGGWSDIMFLKPNWSIALECRGVRSLFQRFVNPIYPNTQNSHVAEGSLIRTFGALIRSFVNQKMKRGSSCQRFINPNMKKGSFRMFVNPKIKGVRHFESSLIRNWKRVRCFECFF